MRTLASTASATETVHAPPEAVYDMISDVARMGEWSPECAGAELHGAPPLQPGSTFTGHNARGDNEWSTECVVLAAQRPSLFSFAAGEPESATTWSYEIRSLGDGRCEVTESFDSIPLRQPDLADQLGGRHALLCEDMAQTLNALKATAESA